MNKHPINNQGEQTMKHLLLSFIVAVLCISCGQGERQTPPQKQEQISQAPDTQSVEMLVAGAREKLTQARLAQQGKYDCCMGDACDHCVLHESSCSCSDEVKHGEAVCNECYAGWQEGKGDVPNIKKENVKADFMEHKDKQ
jgi:hypothetical protein